ncbi:MAG: hypothetical protein LQ337_001761 [Flavoplaca oasis]|nr:MAG: hypothetical protein LQ337_001761 [Flavoplaca oasis]
MPFRAKVKRAFGKNNDDSSEAGSDQSQAQSKSSPQKTKKAKTEYPDNVYKPGQIPDSKYKGPYSREHQVKLHAFNFKTAFEGRRKSDQSLYSPMGTRLPSRKSSFLSRRSFARSRQQSRVDDTLTENAEADDAVGNVGMSRQHTNEQGRRPPSRETARTVTKKNLAADGLVSPAGLEKTTAKKNERASGYGAPKKAEENNHTDGLEPTKTQISRGSFGQPFSADDLVRAMTQSTLKPTAVQA